MGDFLDDGAHGAGGFCAGGAGCQPFDEGVEVQGLARGLVDGFGRDGGWVSQ